MKRYCLLSVISAMLFVLAGCGAKKTMTPEEFKKIEGETFHHCEDIVEKYGPVCFEYKQEVKSSGETVSASIYADGDYYVINTEENETYIYDKENWYRYISNREVPCFSKSLRFEGTDYSALEWYIDVVGYNFAEDEDITITKTEEGYTYVFTYDEENADFGPCTVTGTLYINEDFSIKEFFIVYTNDDGEVFSDSNYFTYNCELPEVVNELKAVLAASGGETRTVTYNYVKDGNITDTIVASAPKGVYIEAIFSAERHPNGTALYKDIDLTDEIKSAKEDNTVDAVVYLAD